MSMTNLKSKAPRRDKDTRSIPWFGLSSFCTFPEIQSSPKCLGLSEPKTCQDSYYSVAMLNPGTTHPSQESRNCSLQCTKHWNPGGEQGMLCTCRSPTPGCPVLPSSRQPLLGSPVHPKGGEMASSAWSCLFMQSLGSCCSNSLDSSPLFQDASMKHSFLRDVLESSAADLNKIL